MLPDEKLKNIEEIVKGMAKSIENETISSFKMIPSDKRSFVNHVSEDSKFKRSFDEYIERIAENIIENFKKHDFKPEDITLYTVVQGLVELYKNDSMLPEESRSFNIIEVNTSDWEKITRLVQENYE
jgi:hypothetical protein